MKKLILPLLILIFAIIYLATGYGSLGFHNLFSTFLGKEAFKEEFILYSIRMPRLVIVLIAGAFLALSGAILQVLFKNPLADPGILGINSGAGVAITIFYLFFPIDSGKFMYVIPIVAFLGSITIAFILLLASLEKGGEINTGKLIMLGLGLSIALSGLMVVLISSSDRIKVEFIVKWLNGNIWGGDWPFILAILPWIFLIFIVLYKINILDVLALSEENAIGLGVNIFREKSILFFIAVSLSASAVAVVGGIPFVGLIAPHLAKSIWGNRAKAYIGNTIFLGAFLLLLADLIGRNILPPNGIATGIVFSLIGAPYLIYLIAKKGI